MTQRLSRRDLIAAGGASILAAPGLARAAPQATLLNVSYDPTREFYKDFNGLFAADWKRSDQPVP